MFGKAVAIMACGFAAVLCVYFATASLRFATVPTVVRSTPTRVIAGSMLLVGAVLPLAVIVLAGVQMHRVLQLAAQLTPPLPHTIMQRFRAPRERQFGRVITLMQVAVWCSVVFACLCIAIGAAGAEAFAFGLALQANDGALCKDALPSWNPLPETTYTTPLNATAAETDWAACSAVAGVIGDRVGRMLASNMLIGCVLVVGLVVTACVASPQQLMSECRRRLSCEPGTQAAAKGTARLKHAHHHKPAARPGAAQRAATRSCRPPDAALVPTPSAGSGEVALSPLAQPRAAAATFESPPTVSGSYASGRGHSRDAQASSRRASGRGAASPMSTESPTGSGRGGPASGDLRRPFIASATPYKYTEVTVADLALLV